LSDDCGASPAVHHVIAIFRADKTRHVDKRVGLAMRFWLIGFALLLSLGWFAHPTRLTLDFARDKDPAPRRFEVAAELAGTVVALAVRWSQSAPTPAMGGSCSQTVRLARCAD
jgi:hypothetical protein